MQSVNNQFEPFLEEGCHEEIIETLLLKKQRGFLFFKS
jgi:hypothetical protein